MNRQHFKYIIKMAREGKENPSNKKKSQAEKLTNKGKKK